MACKLIHNNREFATEQDLDDYLGGNEEIGVPIMLQEANPIVPPSVASSATIKKVKEFLKRIGVDLNSVRQITDSQGNILDANAQANLLKNIIDIVDGKEDVAITEEAMHFAVEILEQTNPKLFTDMLNKIGGYTTYDQVLNSPVYRKQYTLPDGKINVRAMKKEAIGKVLAETFIAQNDETTNTSAQWIQSKDWWTKIKEFFKKLFLKAEFNPFEEAAREIERINTSPAIVKELATKIAEIDSPGIFGSIIRATVEQGDYQGVVDMIAQQLLDPPTYQTTIDQFLGGDQVLGERIVELATPMLQAASNPTVDAIYNRITEIHKKLTLKNNVQTGNSFYEIDGKQIKNRVTDKTNAYYEKVFKAGQMTKTEAQKAIDDQKKDKGTHGHSDMEALFHKYVDDRGYKREIPLSTPKSLLDPDNEAFINKLDAHISELIASYPEGTRFLAETRLYNPSQDQAGTMDFLAIKPDGTVDIRDWKFMEIREQANGDVPWYKKEAFNIQISEYKNILKKNYGVTKFGQTRAIPIKTKYKWKDWQTKDELVLTNIVIGDVDVSKITDLSILPVATKDESTGDRSLDTYIKQLNALHEKLSKEKVEEGRRDIKRDKLNSLERAIRVLQIQKGTKDLVTSATAIISAVERDLEKYNKLLSENTEIDKKTIRDIARRLLDDHDIVSVFKELPATFRRVELSKEERDRLEEISKRAINVIQDISERGGIRQQIADIIARGYGIRDLLDPEFTVAFWQRNFRSLSQAGTKATRVLWKMQERIKAAVAIEYDEEVRKLAAIKQKVEDEAKAKGIPLDIYMKKMLAYRDGKWTGSLIGKINPEFYTKLKAAQKDSNKTWILENIDIEAYNKWYAAKLQQQIDFEENQTYDWQDHEANVAERKKRVENFKSMYSLAGTGLSLANSQLLFYPKRELWKSAEMTELEKLPALKEFYNYWENKMKESHRSGMIQDKVYSRFVPNVERNFFEKQFEGTAKGKNKHLTFFDSVLADNQEEAIDPLTQKPVQNVTPLYLFDLGEFVTNDKGDTYVDYSKKSDDLFKIMALWTAEMSKFKLRTEVEAEAKLIQQVEWNKGHLIGRRGTESEAEGNENNATYFDNFLNSVLYGRKYAGKDDVSVGFNINGYIRNINAATKKAFGHEWLPYSESETLDISVTKTVEKVNRYFQAKTLGFNVPSALTNFLGGKTNAYINAGKDITKADLWFGEHMLVSGKFTTPEGMIAAGLVDYFVPLTDDEKMDKARGLSVKGTAANMSSDWLFYLQRKSERGVQLPIFFAFARNTMVVDGKLVNIRRYVKDKNDYANLYSLGRQEREALKDKIEKEIEALKKDKSLFVVSKIENDQLVIPGIARNSDTVYEFRNMVQQFSKDALGNMDQEDVYQYRMNLIGKSMMMFKNWIPRMADVRFGGLRQEVGKDGWEWGRYSMLWNGLAHNLFNATQAFIGISSGEESLIERAKKMYIIKRSEFGDEFMSEAEFVDMYVRAATQTVKEILIVASLMGAMLAVSSAVPDDDDEITKGAHKWALRLIDKGISELSFFYNPIAMTEIGNGSIFPALGVVVDLQRFAKNALKESFFQITGDEEGQEKTKTVKYLFKAIPITKEFATYMAIFSKEFSEGFGVHVSAEARPSR